MSILIKDMEIPESCAKCTFGDGCSCYAKGYIVQEDDWENKRADFCPLIEICDEDVQPVKWIPVTERLPKKVGWYLVVVLAPFKQVRMYEFYPIHNNYGNDLWRNNDGDHVSNWFVTHWMPLPKLPKDGET